MSEWISVKDRFPNEWERVFLFNANTSWPDNDGIHTGFIDDKKRWISSTWKSLSQESDNVTHWMPLPEPPKETS